MFPLLINLLGSEYNVVHSYAAIAIERLLSVKVCVCVWIGVVVLRTWWCTQGWWAEGQPEAPHSVAS